ncbi:MAG: serine/threonine-protein kinase [Gemmatimonadetes bacterium]|nr:serine/threonine-protein kinase [Gemmatimonadota bacterium]
MVGKQLSHYDIQSKLGEGGMGEVYQASDTKLRRQVAIKVLPAAFAEDAERMARFQREAQVLASLNHPHIAQIFGLEEDAGVHALVLELVEGPTLGDRIKTGRMPLEEILKIAQQVAQALEAAHEQGVIHRDLKPDNVKLTSGGEVKVLDFGLAKAMESSADSDLGMTQSPTMSPAITGAMTGANVILGTAGYMSPEQARGQAVDKRADIWSFGVVVYEMLTGRTLFLGDTVSDTLAAVLRLDPDWDALPPGTPGKLKRLLKRCLERDPDQRLRDIGDARIALQEMIAGDLEEPEVVVAAASGGTKRSTLFAAVGAAAVLAAVVGFFTAQGLQPPPAEPQLLKFRIPVSDLLTSLSDGGTTAAISPDGTRIVYTHDDHLWLRDLADLEPRQLPGTEGGTAPFWSPDGEWIGYGNQTRLYKVRIPGGTPQPLCEVDHSFNPAAGGAWLPDGRIVFTDGSSPLFSVSSQGGDPDTLLHLTPDLDADFHNVSPLPDGRGLLFVLHRVDGTFDRIDLLTADGDRRPLVDMPGEQLVFPQWSPSGHIVFSRKPTNPGIWAVPFDLASLEVTGEPFLAVPDAGHPSVSLNGTMVLAQGSFLESNELAWMSRSGVSLGRIGRAEDRALFFRLSPTGDRVAVRSRGEDQDLYLLDVDRQTQTRLTATDDGREDWPAWTSDGRWLYYQLSENFPQVTIWRKAADGSGSAQEIGPGGWFGLSPDDRTLAYSLGQDGTSSNDWDIWYVHLDENGIPTGDPTLFLDTPSVTIYPQLSPDGRYVAYMSEETGQNEIYLKPFPTGPGKWQVSVDGGHWPRWSADGKTLYFARDQDIVAVSVELDPVRLGAPEVLFRRPDMIGTLPFGWPDGFDVTADGERFLIGVRPEGQEISEDRGLVVVQNWFAEFQDPR